MGAKVRETLAVRKEEAQKSDVERFNIRKLNKLEVRKQYQIKISYKSAVWENLSNRKVINRVSDDMKGISKSQLKRVQVCTN